MIPIATVAAIGAAASAAQSVINKVSEARQKGATDKLMNVQGQALGQKPSMQELMTEFLNKYATTTVQQRDADGNGMLSLQEYGEGPDKFAQLDFNSNGFIEQSELVRSLQQNQNVTSLMTSAASASTAAGGAKAAYAAQVSPVGDRNMSFTV